jgi:hypothetical protein
MRYIYNSKRDIFDIICDNIDIKSDYIDNKRYIKNIMLDIFYITPYIPHIRAVFHQTRLDLRHLTSFFIST